MGIKEDLRKQYMQITAGTPRGMQIRQRYERYKVARLNFPNYWLDLANYYVPFKDDIYTNNAAGERKNLHIYESRPIKYARRLSNALSTLLIPAGQKWMGYTTGDPELDRAEEVLQWMSLAERQVISELMDSNFYVKANEMFQDEVIFGTGVLSVEAGEDNFFHFDAFSVYRCVLASNSRELVDMLYRVYKLTGRQMVQKFGYDILMLPNMEHIRAAYEKDDPNMFEIIFAVEPKDIVKSEKKNSPHAFFGVHVLHTNGVILKEEGFHEFPYAVPRWLKHPEEEYGRGPAMDALPDVMTSNAMKKVILQGGQLQIAPPLQAINNSVMNKFNLKPFGVTYRRPGTEPISPIFTGARSDIGVDLLDYIMQTVAEHFFIPQLDVVEKDRMTATEIMQRKDEGFKDLAGILLRMDREFLSPVINRCFMMLVRAGRIPPPPEIIANNKLKIRYTSPIARAAQAMESENLNRAINSVGILIQAQPQALEVINVEKALRDALRNYDVNPSLVHSEREMDAKKQQQAQMQQRAQEAEVSVMESEAVKNLQG